MLCKIYTLLRYFFSWGERDGAQRQDGAGVPGEAVQRRERRLPAAEREAGREGAARGGAERGQECGGGHHGGQEAYESECLQWNNCF